MAVKDQELTQDYAIYNGDSCEVLPSIKADSIHLSIYSPPFAELYNYSSSDRDLSNCRDYDEFLTHYEFIVKEISRITMPGRCSVVHCMDLKMGCFRRDFPGDIIRLHEKHGLHFHSRNTVWKEPLRVAIRTRSKHLMHRQIVKDSVECGSAGADYILTFRKSGDNPIPISHPGGLTSYAGGLEVPLDLTAKYKNWDDPKTNKLSHWIWQHYASSVWMDIRTGRVMPYKAARESEEEKHVCPLQLDVIERCLVLYSNPGETVLTPFMGVGSEVYCAVRLGRKGIGVELKPSYYRQAQRNVSNAKNDALGETEVMDFDVPTGEVADDEEEDA